LTRAGKERVRVLEMLETFEIPATLRTFIQATSAEEAKARCLGIDGRTLEELILMADEEMEVKDPEIEVVGVCAEEVEAAEAEVEDGCRAICPICESVVRRLKDGRFATCPHFVDLFPIEGKNYMFFRR